MTHQNPQLQAGTTFITPFFITDQRKTDLGTERRHDVNYALFTLTPRKQHCLPRGLAGHNAGPSVFSVLQARDLKDPKEQSGLPISAGL